MTPRIGHRFLVPAVFICYPAFAQVPPALEQEITALKQALEVPIQRDAMGELAESLNLKAIFDELVKLDDATESPLHLDLGIARFRNMMVLHNYAEKITQLFELCQNPEDRLDSLARLQEAVLSVAGSGISFIWDAPEMNVLSQPKNLKDRLKGGVDRLLLFHDKIPLKVIERLLLHDKSYLRTLRSAEEWGALMLLNPLENWLKEESNQNLFTLNWQKYRSRAEDLRAGFAQYSPRSTEFKDLVKRIPEFSQDVPTHEFIAEEENKELLVRVTDLAYAEAIIKALGKRHRKHEAISEQQDALKLIDDLYAEVNSLLLRKDASEEEILELRRRILAGFPGATAGRKSRLAFEIYREARQSGSFNILDWLLKNEVLPRPKLRNAIRQITWEKLRTLEKLEKSPQSGPFNMSTIDDFSALWLHTLNADLFSETDNLLSRRLLRKFLEFGAPFPSDKAIPFEDEDIKLLIEEQWSIHNKIDAIDNRAVRKLCTEQGKSSAQKLTCRYTFVNYLNTLSAKNSANSRTWLEALQESLGANETDKNKVLCFLQDLGSLLADDISRGRFRILLITVLRNISKHIQAERLSLDVAETPCF